MERPNLFIVAGPNGAGKSSVVSQSLLPKGIEVLDADKILADLMKYQLEDPRSRAREIFYGRVDENLAARKSFAFETNLHSSKIVKDPDSIIQRSIARGYTTNLLFVGLQSPEVALERVASRVKAGGHDVDGPTVLHRYQGGLETLKKHVQEFDRVLVLDNTTETARKVLEAHRGHIVQLADKVPDWVKNTLEKPLKAQQDQGIKRGRGI